MTLRSIVGRFLKALLILGVSAIAGAQTQTAEPGSVPQRGNKQYWLMVDKFADAAVHFAYAKRFVEVHKESLTDRQCQQYSRISADYADELAGFRKAGVAAQGEFWNEVRAYSIAMIGAPGVPIPVHRPSNYWVTTGSEAEDIELRRILGLEIDEAHSQLIRRGGYSRSVLTPDRQIAQELPEKPRSEAN